MSQTPSSQNPDVNRRIVLAARPSGAPVPGDFRLETGPVPQPAEGQVLLRTVWLSLDPYMRGRMSAGPSYAEPVPVGGTMVGGTVGRVVASRHPGFAEGDLVAGYAGWQDYALSDGGGLAKLDPGMPEPSRALGVLGMPGFTAYTGLVDIGRPKPGETVVVAAATGAVGSVVGQVAKILGCRAVGIAGGQEKCRYAVEELGFDACLDHRRDDLGEALGDACPDGIHVYFENVGGKVLLAVLPHLVLGARIPLCGIVSQYNLDRPPEGPDHLPALLGTLLAKRVLLQGFIISDSGSRFPAFLERMGPWVRDGRVKMREHRVQGLEAAPEALIGMLEGRNFGKVVVEVGPA